LFAGKNWLVVCCDVKQYLPQRYQFVCLFEDLTLQYACDAEGVARAAVFLVVRGGLEAFVDPVQFFWDVVEHLEKVAHRFRVHLAMSALGQLHHLLQITLSALQPFTFLLQIVSTTITNETLKPSSSANFKSKAFFDGLRRNSPGFTQHASTSTVLFKKNVV
jgi:hypothetical protein